MFVRNLAELAGRAGDVAERWRHHHLKHYVRKLSRGKYPILAIAAITMRHGL